MNSLGLRGIEGPATFMSNNLPESECALQVQLEYVYLEVNTDRGSDTPEPIRTVEALQEQQNITTFFYNKLIPL